MLITVPFACQLRAPRIRAWMLRFIRHTLSLYQKKRSNRFIGYSFQRFLLLLLFFVLYCHHAKLGLDFSSCLCISSDGSRGNIQIDHSTIDAWKPSFQSIFCDNDYRMSSSQIYPPCQNKILYFARLLYFSDCSVL